MSNRPHIYAVEPISLPYNTERKFRFHLLGLVHLPVSEVYMGCAFTQKVVKLSKMLLSLGHEVILYGAEGSDAPCSEFVKTHTMQEIRRAWGDGDNRPECNGLGYQWRKEGFRHDFNEERKEVTLRWYGTTIAEINRRKHPDDFLLIMQGWYQKPVADGVGLFLTCEPGIGYRGSFADWRAFESAYLENFKSGSDAPNESVNGRHYWRVIPNYFDPKDFKFEAEKDDYYLYIGRLIWRKGVEIAARATHAVGGRLVVAGQGDLEECVTQEMRDAGHIEVVGYVDPEQRTELMSKAKAVFVPTEYMEAFGGTNVEAQLSGTPVITTRFGVFPETVVHGVTGFLCATLQDFVHAARLVEKLQPEIIRRHAERYLMDNVRHEFDKWFRDLYQVYLSAHVPGEKGWNHYD